jgi:uncharacterized protein (DUF1499 family)
MTNWIIGLMAFLILVPACTSAVSKLRQAETGLVGNRLRPCPATPNCVCTEFTDQASFAPPASFTHDPAAAWTKAAAVVQAMGGKIITDDGGYLHATFTSRIFRFVDDLELRLDGENGIIHLRSASRTGYSDFGVNRKRAEQFQALFRSHP